MHFVWNESKRQANFTKHGVDFAVAPVVFSGVTVTVVDARKDYGEARCITLGILHGRVVVVVHTQRGETTRIISMRKANEREQRIYYTHLAALGRDDG
jgi:uncharacterized protein